MDLKYSESGEVFEAARVVVEVRHATRIREHKDEVRCSASIRQYLRNAGRIGIEEEGREGERKRGREGRGGRKEAPSRRWP